MSISYESFRSGCVSIKQRWEANGSPSEWHDAGIITQDGTSFLRITKTLPRVQPHHFEAQEDVSVGSEIEDDDEVIVKKPVDPIVIFDIVFSPSYQVPVLHFIFKDLPPNTQSSIGLVETLLVPELLRSQVQSVGVLGGISKADHPVSGLATFFVHPCRTMEAMRYLQQDTLEDPEKYLIAWIGIIGATVGLNIPLSLAAGLETPRHGDGNAAT